LRHREDLDGDDGTAMGRMLLDSIAAFKTGAMRGTSMKMGRLALTVMMEKNRALREIHVREQWFSPMIIKVLNNIPLPPLTVDAELEKLTEKQGRQIGQVR
jgi:hypothetical protein